ncbi:glycosyltransferase [uncultured Dokdonia sp.]|uniref:glycosyltransferase family 2 protein n=1 Tax=uncultured Dokdonia sp. TaxID=575653 RepID=UPI0026245C35|nr:glycosyltransferase [uncultured Dokdonia sp.]
MLSILVPTYNYNIYSLIATIHEQLETIAVPFEIIVSDDQSSLYTEENKKVNILSHTKYLFQKQNLGRTKNREVLATTATYDWLLFLDADVVPATSSFIQNYIDELHQDIDVIYGGVSYQEKSPNSSTYLRWYYGKHRESQSIKKRLQQPCFIISQNLLIKKDFFLKANISTENRYGLDNLFSHQLKVLNARIKHINNPIIHLGLEENTVFLKKTLEAVETTVYYEQKKLMECTLSNLQKSYCLLEKRKITGLFLRLVTPFKKRIEKKLLSSSPSLFLFDIYKLHHYASLKKRVDA